MFRLSVPSRHRWPPPALPTIRDGVVAFDVPAAIVFHIEYVPVLPPLELDPLPLPDPLPEDDIDEPLDLPEPDEEPPLDDPLPEPDPDPEPLELDPEPDD